MSFHVRTGPSSVPVCFLIVVASRISSFVEPELGELLAVLCGGRRAEVCARGKVLYRWYWSIVGWYFWLFYWLIERFWDVFFELFCGLFYLVRWTSCF